MKYDDYISQFESIKELPKGGQKKVFKVTKANEDYAFKVIENCADKRILQEIEILQSLNIEGVPKVIDTGILEKTEESVLYILEEYINSVSLRGRLEVGELLNLSQAYKIIYDLLKIEIELEKNGIIHRDIKPDNVLLTPDNKTYLIDFGVAKVQGNVSLTAVNQSFGPHTPGYAPYEQIMNDRLSINSKTDLFEIGVTVYELISGVNPFVDNSQNLIDVITRTMSLKPERLDIQGDTLGRFNDFLSILMAKNQSQRPENAETALRYLVSIKDSLELEVI